MAKPSEWTSPSFDHLRSIMCRSVPAWNLRASFYDGLSVDQLTPYPPLRKQSKGASAKRAAFRQDGKARVGLTRVLVRLRHPRENSLSIGEIRCPVEGCRRRRQYPPAKLLPQEESGSPCLYPALPTCPESGSFSTLKAEPPLVLPLFRTLLPSPGARH